MSPEERSAWIRRNVDAAPPLSAAQAATLRGILLSGHDSEKPPELIAQGAAHPRSGSDANLDRATDKTGSARRGQPIGAG